MFAIFIILVLVSGLSLGVMFDFRDRSMQSLKATGRPNKKTETIFLVAGLLSFISTIGWLIIAKVYL